jgi:hypothetical protein
MATGVLHAWRRIHQGQRLFVLSRFPELFDHNPDVLRAFSERTYHEVFKRLNKPVIWRIGNAIGGMVIKPTYPFPSFGKHLMDSMSETIGVSLLPEEHHPVLYLTSAEKKGQVWALQCIAVQSSSTSYWTPNKNWVAGRMQSVVNELIRLGYKIIQLGVLDDEPLQNVLDLRGKTTLRESAAILANTLLFIGMEGGLVHMARAVGTTSVVIYTGYTTPDETGYSENANLRASTAGKSCWSRIPCEHCRQSAELITVANVINESASILQHHTEIEKIPEKI